MILKEFLLQNAEHNIYWLYNMLARIRFSALGFFNINYSSLFGFISALITYLVILIQFNSLSDSPEKPTLTQSSRFEAPPSYDP